MDAEDHRRDGTGGMLQLGAWATAAVIAMLLATLASVTPRGSERLALALTQLSGGEPRQGMQAVARKAELEVDRRSVNEALRLLASDRDRLSARLSSLERNLDDVTGSIKSQAVSRPPHPGLPNPPFPDPLPADVGEAQPKLSDAPPWTSQLPDFWPPSGSGSFSILGPASSIRSPPWPATPPVRVTAMPAAAQATPPAQAPSRTEFGVDIGSGSDLTELRALWNQAKAQHGKLIGNLRPIVVRREDRAGNPDFRLVIGPLANAGAAAKLCATFGAADLMCSTRPYLGERLPP